MLDTRRAAVRNRARQRDVRATLIPIAITEGGCLFSLTAWLLNASVVPLVTALVLLSLSI